MGDACWLLSSIVAQEPNQLGRRVCGLDGVRVGVNLMLSGLKGSKGFVGFCFIILRNHFHGHCGGLVSPETFSDPPQSTTHPKLTL